MYLELLFMIDGNLSFPQPEYEFFGMIYRDSELNAVQFYFCLS